jgi:hypothetical protein
MPYLYHDGSFTYVEPTDAHIEYGQTKDNKLDVNTIMFIRSARIWNPQLNNLSPTTYNMLDVKTAVNETTGKVILTMEIAGYISPRQSNMTDYKDISYNPEDRVLDEVTNKSNEEKIPLSYPFMWVGQNTWAGINYIPPLNSEVIVGFGRRHDVFILGYLNPDFKSCKPYLKPGEIMIKGAGNNYIHTRWSNKLDIFAAANAGDQDRDAKEGDQKVKASCELWIRLDADNGYMELFAQGASKEQRSGIRITPQGVSFLAAGQTSVEMTPDGINRTAGTVQSNVGAMNENTASQKNN